MNRWLLPSAVARPWQTPESWAAFVRASWVVCAAFEAFAMTKAPPPAIVAAPTSRAIFFF
ncbi:hypothetical protein SVIOM342S_08151 [Streptomyces violaceorubidus]